MKKSLLVCSLILTCCMFFGCAGAQKKHPGSFNDFDSTTADVLADTQNVLSGLSDHINDYPKALQPVNDARAAYNIFKNDYLLWRCTVGITQTVGPNGPPCPAGTSVTQAQVQADQQKTQQAVSAAQAAENGGKQP